MQIQRTTSLSGKCAWDQSEWNHSVWDHIQPHSQKPDILTGHRERKQEVLEGRKKSGANYVEMAIREEYE